MVTYIDHIDKVYGSTRGLRRKILKEMEIVLRRNNINPSKCRFHFSNGGILTLDFILRNPSKLNSEIVYNFFAGLRIPIADAFQFYKYLDDPENVTLVLYDMKKKMGLDSIPDHCKEIFPEDMSRQEQYKLLAHLHLLDLAFDRLDEEG